MLLLWLRFFVKQRPYNAHIEKILVKTLAIAMVVEVLKPTTPHSYSYHTTSCEDSEEFRSLLLPSFKIMLCNILGVIILSKAIVYIKQSRPQQFSIMSVNLSGKLNAEMPI